MARFAGIGHPHLAADHRTERIEINAVVTGGQSEHGPVGSDDKQALCDLGELAANRFSRLCRGPGSLGVHDRFHVDPEFRCGSSEPISATFLRHQRLRQVNVDRG